MRGGGVPVRERGPGRSHRPDPRPPSAFRAHQPGIATPQLDHVALGAFDLAGAGACDVLHAWTAAAEGLMRAGEATVTVGLGAAACAPGARPLGLRPLPPFPGDALEPGRSGGDLVVQACAPEAEAASAALERMAAAAAGAARPRWRQAGFLRRDRERGSPRDLLGFRDGTNNLRRGIDHDRHVWVRARERTWMVGGAFLVMRRIRVDLEAWAQLPVEAQEAVIGRRRDTGVPVGGGPPERLPPDSHVRLAAPRENGGAAILRRGYDYDDGRDPATGRRDAGLLFLAYMADPRRQYVPLQRRLAEHDALSRFVVHSGSAVFAVPPGARPGGFLGEGGA